MICQLCLASPEVRDGVMVRHDRAHGRLCPMSGEPPFVWDEVATRAAVKGRSGEVCEACCRQRATDMHHRIPRSLGGGWHPANILHVCRGCHDWLEEGKHRAEARGRGLLLRSADDPAKVPVTRLTGVTLFLSDDISAPLKKRGR